MKASEFKKAVGDTIRGHLGVEDKFVTEQIPAKIDEVYAAGQASGGGASDPAAEAVMALLRKSPFTSVDGDDDGTHGVFYSMDTPTHPGYCIIPAHVTEIANGALDIVGGSWTGNAGGRSLLLSLPEEPPISGGFGGWSENGNGRPPKFIYVPDGSVDAYKAAENWSEFANLILPMSDLLLKLSEVYLFGSMYEFPEGMTWGEYIESPYVNEWLRFYVDSDGEHITTPGGRIYSIITSEEVKTSDVVFGAYEYVM